MRKLSEIDVLVLAAGFGKRLGERTANIPKPLVSVGGKTLIERNLEQLQRAGFRRVCINLHYRGDQIRAFVGDGARWGLQVTYSEEAVILDTGGAIKNIEAWYQSDIFFTVNSDIFIEDAFPFEEVLQWQLSQPHSTIATLVLRQDENARQYGEFGLDSAFQVRSFLGVDYGRPEGEVTRGYMYTGIQCLDRRILPLMPPVGSVFSITKNTFREILVRGVHGISGYNYQGFWIDAGTEAGISACDKFLLRKSLSS